MRWLACSVAVLVSCSERRSEPPVAVGGDALGQLRAIPALSSALLRAAPLRAAPGGYLPDPPARAATRFYTPLKFSSRLPAEADGVMRFVEEGNHFVEVRAEGRAHVAARVVDHALVFADAEPYTDVVVFAESSRVEELRVLREPRAPNVARYRLTKGPGIASFRLREGIVEALDAEGYAHLRTTPLVAWDADGREVPVTVVLAGDEMIVRVEPAGHRHPIVVDPGFGPASSMAFARRFATVTVLGDGKILVAGGETATPGDAYSSVEIYNPGLGTFTLANPMGTKRVGHTATRLPNGTVFVTGGFNSTANQALSTTESYAESTGAWTPKASMPVGARDSVAAQVLVGGTSSRVLVAGGSGNSGIVAERRTYDPVGDAWNTTTGTFTGRSGAAAIALSATRVLVCGGVASTSCANAMDICEIYDGGSNTWSAGTSMQTARLHFSMGIIGSKVLAAGGAVNNCYAPVASSELYDVSQNTWTALPAMTHARAGASTVTIQGRYGLVIGGHGPDASSAESYDTATNAWSAVMPLAFPRGWTGAANLTSGTAIVIGGSAGFSSSEPVTATTELYADALPSGSGCQTASWCASGNCVDGFCCDRKCDLACESCNEAGSFGTCTVVTGAPRGARTCAGTGACKGACTGNASCTFPTAATACVTASCTGGVAQPGAFCDGAGTCGATPATVDCAPYACGAVGCKATCAGDADCISTHFCQGTTCTAKAGNGGACTAGNQCSSGFCVDGVCCNETCTGACKACGLSGSEGVCTTETVCSDNDAGTDAAPVDASSDTSTPPTDTGTVATDTGTVATDTGTPVIDTGTGVAETPAPTLPEKPGVTGEFQRCAKASECASGFCVDGVCCDSACKDKCHTCALLSSPGRCTISPIGVDLRNDCGPANQCLGTCGGDGQCIGSGNGTMCGRNRCVGASKGVGPAYCPGPGAACGLDQAVPFDCAPYACEPAFGACITSCRSSDDCANGFVCDVPTKACIRFEAPPVEDSGCAVSAPRSRTSSLFGLCIALALVAAGRRSRALRRGFGGAVLRSR